MFIRTALLMQNIALKAAPEKGWLFCLTGFTGSTPLGLEGTMGLDTPGFTGGY